MPTCFPFLCLCRRPNWQLSRIGEEKEKKKYTLEDGTVQVGTATSADYFEPKALYVIVFIKIVS